MNIGSANYLTQNASAVAWEPRAGSRGTALIPATQIGLRQLPNDVGSGLIK